MKSFRASLMVPVLGLVAMFASASSMVACGGQNPAESNVSTTSSVMAAAHEHGPMGHGGGPAMLVFAALHEPIGLNADQKSTIETVAESLKPKAPPTPDASHVAALSAAIRAGKIDVSALSVKPPVNLEVDRDAEIAKALTTLHATLTKDQRAALVAAIEQREQKHEGHEKNGDHEKMKGEHEHFGPMKMLDGLNLTQDQKDAIHTQLEAARPPAPTDAEREAMKARWQEMKKEHEAKLQSFVSDSFDANAFVAKPANMPEMKMNPGDHWLKTLSVIVPILTPAQREQLATKIEQGPPAPAVK